MFQFNFSKALKAILLTSHLITGAFSPSAQAELSSYSYNGVDFVYSSVSDVSWPKDSNLLETMMKREGKDSLISKIVAVTPTVTSSPDFHNPTGIYPISDAEFHNLNLGQTTWFGAIAFTKYLNYIKYAGRSDWKLPTTEKPGSVSSPPLNGQNSGNQLSELFFNELNGKAFDDSIFTLSRVFKAIQNYKVYEDVIYGGRYLYINDSWESPQKSITINFSRNYSPGWLNGGDNKRGVYHYVWPFVEGDLRVTIPEITIVRAWYGQENKRIFIINNNRVVDTIKSNQSINQRLYIPANMNAYFGGDPIPNEAKLVGILVKWQNKYYELRQLEGKALKFPGVEGTDYYLDKQ